MDSTLKARSPGEALILDTGIPSWSSPIFYCRRCNAWKIRIYQCTWCHCDGGVVARPGPLLWIDSWKVKGKQVVHKELKIAGITERVAVRYAEPAAV